MDIVVCVKYVPDAASKRSFDTDGTTDRASTDGLLSELDEYAVEEALTIIEASSGSITALTMGPADATTALKKALQMGADAGVHVLDDGLHGSDAAATARVLAAAISTLPHDLILCGMASTDGTMAVLPAMLAEHLQLPQVTLVSSVEVDGGTVRGRRDAEDAALTLEASLPAVVSVTDQTNTPRYPSFKGVMAAKKKPVQTLSLADLGIEASDVGLDSAWTEVVDVTRRPARSSGQLITDDGTAATQLADFLAAEKLI